MQWFFLIVIFFWIFAALAIPIIAFCMTKNLLCLSGFTTLAPPTYILHRVTAYIFPKDDRDYRLAEMKILHKGANSKKKVP
jgi:hypothetical protein